MLLIAVAGKGGTGKTSVTGLLIDYMARHGFAPVLAVDADANSNLNEVLGVEAPPSLGELREEIAKGEFLPENPVPAGMSKPDYAEMKFADALAEQDDYDLLVMGRTQGAGCYCFVNGLLQTQIAKYSGRYKYVVVDNEAGMEHLSRGVLPKVDVLLLVSDCSRRSVQAAGRIQQLANDLKLNPGKIGLVVNKSPSGPEPDPGVLEEIALQKLELLQIVPQDASVYEYDARGLPLAQLPETSAIKTAVAELAGKILL